MYSLAGFGEMIADGERFTAFAEALRRSVAPGSVVLDVGAGTGIFSLLACRFGARRVYALEPSPLAPLLLEAARDNGFADRIVLVRERSSQLTLPERVDVMISDVRGVLPVFQSHLADIADARERLLKPGGKQIGMQDRLFAAVVCAEQAFAQGQRPWLEGIEGLVLKSALTYAHNAWCKLRARPEDLLSAPGMWASLDYRTLSDTKVRGAGTLPITTSGRAHGLLAWFDADLAEGVSISNHPAAPPLLYGQAYFRWPEAQMLERGDFVDFELRADPVGPDYQWTWTTSIRRGNQPDRVQQRFRQSDFLSVPLTSELLHRRAETSTPSLKPRGELARRVLQRMDGTISLGELAAELHAAHADHFPSNQAALDFVADLADRYGL